MKSKLNDDNSNKDINESVSDNHVEMLDECNGLADASTASSLETNIRESGIQIGESGNCSQNCNTTACGDNECQQGINPSTSVIANDQPDDDGDEERISGRRIVELDFFLQQLKEFSLHNFGKCRFSDLETQKEIRNGLRSKIVLQCNSCGKKFIAKTSQDENTEETMCLNSTAVLAANMVGIGFSQLEQFTSVLSVPVMSSVTFKKYNDKIGEFWEQTAEDCMKKAAEEERQAAIGRGDVDEEDGIPFVSVVTDECWSKRSYNKNYTALSGVASIVGAHTNKVLWIGVRNKYCVMCVRYGNKDLTPPPHFCTRNYSGLSSDMEWQSILEGFQKSIELYNMRYMRIIADGDSSTYAKIIENRPYGHRHVLKDECTNHLKRNFWKQLDKAVVGCPRGLNKVVCNNLERIRKDVCCAVEYRKKENTTEAVKIASLKSDLNNIFNHVFGDHAKCPAYIKKSCKDTKNYIPALTACGTLEKMSKIMRKLTYCAKDLLKGETNNVAEHYNSIVAKLVGGKRINFSLSNAYQFKANAAAVQHNTLTSLSTFYRTKFKRRPSPLARKIELRRLQKCRRERDRRRRLKENKVYRKRFRSAKESGSGYGENCQTTDLSPENLENEKEVYKEKLAANQRNRISIEENTRDKHESDLWQQMERMVLMSSNFGSICKARKLDGHVKKLLKCTSAETKSIRHERESEPMALMQLATQEKIIIQSCGLLIDEEDMCLAASPTGIVDAEHMIIMIKSPSAIFNMDPLDASVLGK